MKQTDARRYTSPRVQSQALHTLHTLLHRYGVSHKLHTYSTVEGNIMKYHNPCMKISGYLDKMKNKLTGHAAIGKNDPHLLYTIQGKNIKNQAHRPKLQAK